MRYQSTPFAEVRTRGVLLWLAAAGLAGGPLLWWIGRRAGVQDPDLLAATGLVYATVLTWIARQVRRTGATWSALLAPPGARAGWSAVLWFFPLFCFAVGATWGGYFVHAALDPAYVPEFLRPDPDDLLPRSAGYRALEVLLAVLVAPVVEELFFRGVLLHRWAARWGLVPGVLASSVAFGVGHDGILDATVFGLVMALLYLRTATLWIPIAAHALNNALASALWLLDGDRYPVRSAEAALAEFRADWWIGALGLAISLPLLAAFFRGHRHALRAWLPG